MALRLFTSVLTAAHSSAEAMGDLDALIEEGFELPSDRSLTETPKGNYLQDMIARLDWYKKSETELHFSVADKAFNMSPPRAQPSQLLPTLSAGGNLVFSKSTQSPFSSLSFPSHLVAPASPCSPASPVTPAKSNKKRSYSCVSDEEAFWVGDACNSRRRIA